MAEWYEEYLQTERWQRLRTRCFERDGYKCQFCLRSDSLEAHHTRYDNLGNEDEELELCDLITLCRNCHQRLHDGMDHIASLSDYYKKIRLALVLPALPAAIKAREAEIAEGAQKAHEILNGCPRGNGIPNRVYRMVADEIERRRNSSLNISDMYLMRNFLPGLYEGIQKNENIMYKREQRGEK